MSKAIFLDRDGTINIDKSYLYQIDEFEYLPGVKEALLELQQAGYLLIVITNQSGIGRGYYSEDDYQSLMRWMTDDLKKSGIQITADYHCPHLPDAQVSLYRQTCNCRKPETGMFEQAIADYEIDPSLSFCIGDRIRDLSPCSHRDRFPGIRGYLLYTDGENAAETNTSNPSLPYITQVSGGLLEAAKAILGQKGNE